MNDKKLKMSFDPHTIEHLGIKMYSVLPNAIAELIANAYDADATEVHIRIINTKDDKRIIVSDNGVGMTFNEINEFFFTNWPQTPRIRQWHKSEQKSQSHW